MKILDLTQGLTDNPQYKAFKFHGGEVHFKLKDPLYYYKDNIKIISRVTSSDELVLLMLVVDTLRKDETSGTIEVFLPYMPYQQADRDFSYGECFSLKTITNLLNTLEVDKYVIFDPHSDVSPALLKNCKVIDNSEYINNVLCDIRLLKEGSLEDNLCIISPDAGAYKKIGKLCSKLNWNGELVAANKFRSILTGNIESIELSTDDFKGKDVLIIDDICVGGRTFISLAQKLRERNCGNVYLAISHGVFSNGFAELGVHIDKIYTTNSFKDIEEPKPFFINQIKIL